ncbi:hypothetical protein HanIR_Chr15g0784361 [Helianthus annuus]|nr:hypothetical protein HanIR_Chr15g0784361 [Helianthus annuus]
MSSTIFAFVHLVQVYESCQLLVSSVSTINTLSLMQPTFLCYYISYSINVSYTFDPSRAHLKPDKFPFIKDGITSSGLIHKTPHFMR